MIAIAGGADKCKYLEEELGVDEAIDYKSPDFKREFIKKVGYLDVYFDNVGGEILDLALTRLKKGARIACAFISFALWNFAQLTRVWHCSVWRYLVSL